MKIPEVEMIKKIRKQINISQIELAEASGVSQSLIARLEAGKTDPSYQNVKKVFDALEKLGKGKIMLAKDIMNKNIVCIEPNLSVKEAAKIMKKKNISQLPIMKHNTVLGSITEKTILEKVASEESILDLALTPVSEIMTDVFPIVDANTSLTVISFLLDYNHAVMIKEKGELKGIITKADMLKLF
jgi:predicted transcriptional regulator